MQKLVKLQNEIAIQTNEIKLEEQATLAFKKQGPDADIVRMGRIEELTKMYDNLAKLERDRNSEQANLIRNNEQVLADDKKSLAVKESALRLEMQGLEFEKTRLEFKGVTRDEEQQLYDINEKLYLSRAKMAWLEYETALRSGTDRSVATDTLIAAMHTATLAQNTEDIETANKGNAEALKEIRADLAGQTLELEKQIKLLEIQNADESKILALQEKSAKLQIRENALSKQLTNDTAEKQRMDNAILKLNIDLLDVYEKQRRAVDPLYDAFKRIESSVATSHQFLSDLLVKGGTDVGEGVATIFTDATGGFQSAQQEAANLKGTLAELIQEKNNILADGIITDDELERFQELNQEIDKTNDSIKELESPIHNLEEAFKDFFKSTIDGIREMINKWIAMQIVMGIGKALTYDVSTVGAGDPAYSPFYHMAKGGLLPQIESFRSFSQGGMTSRPTLALLGDNSSKKEIILPTENIKEGSAGPAYLRDSGSNVTIINVVTEEALANEMAKPKLGKVIINRVYENVDSGGILAKRLGR